MSRGMIGKALGPVPQFAIARPCPGCPFRQVSKLGRLGSRTAKRVADSIDADHPFACHQTTTVKGRELTHPKARYCAGAMLYSLARAESSEAPLPTFMQLGERLGLFDPEQLEPVPVWGSRAEFVEWHSAEE